MAQLSLDEKKFLLAVERGDVASTRRWVSYAILQTKFYNPASIFGMQLQMGTEKINVELK
jgi:hypothetical protein